MFRHKKEVIYLFAQKKGEYIIVAKRQNKIGSATRGTRSLRQQALYPLMLR